jgi:hypothetical protein
VHPGYGDIEGVLLVSHFAGNSKFRKFDLIKVKLWNNILSKYCPSTMSRTMCGHTG